MTVSSRESSVEDKSPTRGDEIREASVGSRNIEQQIACLLLERFLFVFGK